MKISDMATNVNLNTIMNKSGYMEEYMNMYIVLYTRRNRKLETAFVTFHRKSNDQIQYFFDKFGDKKATESEYNGTPISETIKGHVIDLFTKMMEP